MCWIAWWCFAIQIIIFIEIDLRNTVFAFVFICFTQTSRMIELCVCTIQLNRWFARSINSRKLELINTCRLYLRINSNIFLIYAYVRKSVKSVKSILSFTCIFILEQIYILVLYISFPANRQCIKKLIWNLHEK